MPKSPQMEKFLDEITKQAFGRSRGESIRATRCVTCGGAVTGFKDALSRREYEISGMCQACQDSVFGEGDETEGGETND